MRILIENLESIPYNVTVFFEVMEYLILLLDRSLCRIGKGLSAPQLYNNQFSILKIE